MNRSQRALRALTSPWSAIAAVAVLVSALLIQVGYLVDGKDVSLETLLRVLNR